MPLMEVAGYIVRGTLPLVHPSPGGGFVLVVVSMVLVGGGGFVELFCVGPSSSLVVSCGGTIRRAGPDNNFVLKLGDNLNLWRESFSNKPLVTPVLNALRSCSVLSFVHFLVFACPFGKFCCMCFVMALLVDPFDSSKVVMALHIKSMKSMLFAACR